MDATNQQLQGRILRFAGGFDFLVAVAFLLGPRIGITMEPFARNAAAAFLLVGATAMFVLARRADRLAAQATGSRK